MCQAVLGGSFDPVHNGHVAMVDFVLKNKLATKVMVIPAFLSPFKDGSTASAEDRLAMVRKAFAEVENCLVDDREILRRGSSYMVETLEELHELDPEQLLRLILGADNLAGFFQWKRSERILELAEVLVLGRYGQEGAEPEHQRESFLFFPHFDHRVSSTEIRAMLAKDEEVGQLLPPSVVGHIRENSLYR